MSIVFLKVELSRCSENGQVHTAVHHDFLVIQKPDGLLQVGVHCTLSRDVTWWTVRSSWSVVTPCCVVLIHRDVTVSRTLYSCWNVNPWLIGAVSMFRVTLPFL